jgi:hypothetical protein
MKGSFVVAVASAFLSASSLTAWAQDGRPSRADCGHIQAAQKKAHAAALDAWGWGLGLNAQTSVMPMYLGHAQYFANEDARDLDAFLRTPALVTDPVTKAQADCRPLQDKARALRAYYGPLSDKYDAALKTCAGPASIRTGQCGKAAGDAMDYAEHLRAGPVTDFERAAAPGACKRNLIVQSDLDTPACLRMTSSFRMGRLCGILLVDEPRQLLAAAAAELKQVQDPMGKVAAQAALTSINASLADFDRFGRGRSDEKLLLTASIHAAQADDTVATVAGSLCPASGAHGPAEAAPERAEKPRTDWVRHLRVRN